MAFTKTTPAKKASNKGCWIIACTKQTIQLVQSTHTENKQFHYFLWCSIPNSVTSGSETPASLIFVAVLPRVRGSAYGKRLAVKSISIRMETPSLGHLVYPDSQGSGKTPSSLYSFYITLHHLCQCVLVEGRHLALIVGTLAYSTWILHVLGWIGLVDI